MRKKKKSVMVLRITKEVLYKFYSKPPWNHWVFKSKARLCSFRFVVFFFVIFLLSSGELILQLSNCNSGTRNDNSFQFDALQRSKTGECPDNLRSRRWLKLRRSHERNFKSLRLRQWNMKYAICNASNILKSIIVE